MFHVIGHRGSSGYRTENTRDAFVYALEAGVQEVELDVRLTKDHFPVLIHDANINRLTGRSGEVADYDVNEFLAIPINFCLNKDDNTKTNSFYTLEELFKEFGQKFTYHIDLKIQDNMLVECLMRCIYKHHLEKHVVAVSFFPEILKYIQKINPSIPLGLMVDYSDTDIESYILFAAENHFSQVIALYHSLTKNHITLAHNLKLEVRAYGVEKLNDLLRLLCIGCDGATLKYPDLLKFKQSAKEVCI